MYFEQSHSNREAWKYTYLGAEIEKQAKALRDRYGYEEQAARDKLAGLLRDPTVNQNDYRLEDLRREIESNGKNHEACKVYAHEFARNPGREYHLSLGDVVYFGLVR